MEKHYVATLLCGSGLGATILGVVFALVYLKKNNIDARLKVNIRDGSLPAILFFKDLKPMKSIEIIDMPIKVAKINTKDHVITPSLNGVELFHAPDIPNYALFRTDYDLLQTVFTSFWKEADLFNYSEANYVCLHLRRGDKLIYEKNLKVHSVEDYKREIDKKGLSETSVMVITDTYSAYLEFKNKYPGLIVGTTSLPTSNGFNITNINRESKDVVADEVYQMIRDFNVIYNSSYFIGTKSSSVSLIGQLLKSNKNISILE